MITITELGPGYYRFDPVWTQQKENTATALLVDLELTGPDEIVTKRKLTWVPPVNRMKLPDGIFDIAEQISAIQSWRAVPIGNEISIGVADSDYYGKVTMELR